MVGRVLGNRGLTTTADLILHREAQPRLCLFPLTTLGFRRRVLQRLGVLRKNEPRGHSVVDAPEAAPRIWRDNAAFSRKPHCGN